MSDNETMQALPKGTALHVWYSPCNLCGAGYRGVLQGGPLGAFRRCDKANGEYQCKGFLTLLGISVRRDGKEVKFVSSADALSRSPVAPIWGARHPLPDPPEAWGTNRIRKRLN